MIPLQEFKLELQKQINKAFPKEEYEVNREIVNKVQRTYAGIRIMKKGGHFAFFVDPEKSYEMYLDNVPMSKIVEEIIDAFHEEGLYGDMKWLNDYEKVKERLFLKVMPYDPVNPKLKDVPYQLIEDILMTYHVLISGGTGRSISCIVTYEMLENFHVSLEVFEKDAMASAMKLFPVLLEDYIKEKDSFFKILSNDKYHNGAATLFYPGIFQQIEKLGSGNFIILPSSIHEVYIVKDTKNKKFEEIDEMIKDCNQRYCESDEILSDHGYYYDREYGKLETFQNYLKRKKIKH